MRVTQNPTLPAFPKWGILPKRERPVIWHRYITNDPDGRSWEVLQWSDGYITRRRF
jgi:hypothetical protein